MYNPAEHGTNDAEADFNNVVPNIQQRCPSFQTISVHRTPHAGILYVHFKANQEDLIKICGFCRRSNTHMSVHGDNNELTYRFGVTSGKDEYFISQMDNENA